MRMTNKVALVTGAEFVVDRGITAAYVTPEPSRLRPGKGKS